MLRKLAVVFIVVGLIAPFTNSNASAASDFIDCKDDEYDGYSVIPSFDITEVCVFLLQSDAISTNIYFALYFQGPISQYMFTSSGSWAGILIDSNADGKPDIQVQTTGKAYPSGTGDVAAAIYKNGVLSNCAATTFANAAPDQNYIAFKFSRSCINLQPSNIQVQGYADYIANDGKWFDWAPDSGWWLDFYQWTLANPGVATSTTSTTTSTSVAVTLAPNAPSSLAIARISENAIRLTWLDNSSNEDGFLLQRDDTPVSTGTSVGAWPFRANAGVTSWDLTGLVTGKRYCLTVSSYNAGGVSSWADWTCVEVVATSVSGSPAVAGSLTCDAARGKVSGSTVLLKVTTGIANAGRKLVFEFFLKGKWVNAGSARVNSGGVANLAAVKSLVGQGKIPIRASQGSRFICEGSIG